MPPKKAAASKNTQESCDANGKDLNIKTGRCVKKCGPNQERDPDSFKCKKKAATRTQKARKPRKAKSARAKTPSPQPESLSFDNYQPRDVRRAQPYEQNFSRKSKSPLRLGYNYPSPQTRKNPQIVKLNAMQVKKLMPYLKQASDEAIIYSKIKRQHDDFNKNAAEELKKQRQIMMNKKHLNNYPQSRPNIKPPSPIKRSLQEEIKTEQIDKTTSLLDFVKKHPAKINEKELENRMKNIQDELRLKIKDLNPNDVNVLQQAQQKLVDEIEKLDDDMAKNVANGVIIAEQEKVAQHIDALEEKVNKSTSWSSPALSTSSVSSSALFESPQSFPSSVSSSSSYTTPQRSSPDINWSPPTPDFNERFTRKNRGPPPKLKKHLKLKPRNPKFDKKTRPKTRLAQAWQDYENKVKGSKQSPMNLVGRTRRASASPNENLFSNDDAWRDDENKVKGSKQSPMKLVGRTRRNSNNPTPTSGWVEEFGNKGFPPSPQPAPEKHKGASPGWSNSPDSPDSPSPNYDFWGNPILSSPESAPAKKGWLWG